MYRCLINTWLLSFVTVVLFSLNTTQLQGQIGDPTNFDFSTVKIDEVEDSQIRQLLIESSRRGLSVSEMEAEAISRGMPYQEVIKLRNRIALINREESGMRDGTINSGRTVTGLNGLRQEYQFAEEPDEEQSKVFGHELFRRTGLTFEPSLNVPTPANYQVGPGDEIVIEVWGASQQTYNLRVSPEGQINISNVGPVRVSGLTVEKASELIISRLSTIYSGLRGSNPNTFAQVSLGNIRSIKVTLTGDVYRPGTYTLPAFATAFNALYYAGGPSITGSYRDIKVVRGGETIASIDIYDFLVHGKTPMNVRLQDEDILFISPLSQQISIEGEINRPALYELKDGETMADLILYSGGFSPFAYSNRLTVDRSTGRERKLLDIEAPLYSSFLMRSGDSVAVGRILDRYENRVSVTGAVFREGEYALTPGMGVKKLVEMAEGVREDAFLHRVALYRQLDDLQIEVYDFDLSLILLGEASDIELQREDLLMISSRYDLRQEQSVGIAGEVKNPGTFDYSLNLSLGELVRLSGGLNDAASLARVEIARRVTDREALTQSGNLTEIFTFPIDSELLLTDQGSSFRLEPFDMVFVRRSPGYSQQIVARVSGEVNFPGGYAISRRSERISDLVNRAGGLTPEAYLPGATLRRRMETSAEERMERLAALDTSGIDIEEIGGNNRQAIGIDLEKILKNPYGRYDLILMAGDELVIPQELQTVRLNGALLYPVTTRYHNRMGLRGYVSQAGGFASNAQKNNVYVLYANGSVDRTRNYLLFRSYPRIEPGAEIIVPEKPDRPSRSIQETLSISSALTSLALVIVTIINQL